MKQGAEKIYLLAVRAQTETVLVDAAQVCGFVKIFTGRRKVYRHLAGTGQAALVTAQTAAAAQVVPVIFPFAVFGKDTRKAH